MRNKCILNYGERMDYYKQIFKRKSFHLFRDTGVITDQKIRELEEFIESVKPLYAEINTEVCIVPENETTCKRGGQFCLLFYSERKEGYLQNIGYLGSRLICTLHQRILGHYGSELVDPKKCRSMG